MTPARRLVPVAADWQDDLAMKIADVLLEFAAVPGNFRDTSVLPKAIRILMLVQDALDAEPHAPTHRRMVRPLAEAPLVTAPLTFPSLPGVLRRCSPVIVHEDADDDLAPRNCRGAIVSVPDEWTGDGFLVALEDGRNTVEWSGKVPSWILSLDLSDQTGVDHLREWLARTVLRGRKTPPIGSVWYYAGCWRLRVSDPPSFVLDVENLRQSRPLWSAGLRRGNVHVSWALNTPHLIAVWTTLQDHRWFEDADAEVTRRYALQLADRGARCA